MKNAFTHWHQSNATYIRLEDERTARLAEVAAVEADLKLLGVVVGQVFRYSGIQVFIRCWTG